MKPAHELSRQTSYGENRPAGTVRVTSAYGFRPPNLSNDRPQYADARTAERRRGGSYRGQELTTQGYSLARPVAVRYARGAILGTDSLLAHAGDSVGVVLSPVLLFNLRICFLLFRNELFYRRLWRSSSPEGVAPRGSDRTHCRCADMCGLS